MTESRAMDADASASTPGRALHEYATLYISLLLFATDSTFLGKGCAMWTRPALPIDYRLRLARRFDPPRYPETFRLQLERDFRSEFTQAGARSGSSSCH